MINYPKLSAIVARSRNGVIGRDGDLPWRLPGDLKYFKQVTLGKPVIMGRKTWESLPFPLPGRPNIVITRDKSYAAKKAHIAHNIRDGVGLGFELAAELGVDEVMLIGGAQLYARLLPLCDRVYVTEVDVMIEGDAHFPAIPANQFDRIEVSGPHQGEKDDYPYRFLRFERKNA